VAFIFKPSYVQKDTNTVNKVERLSWVGEKRTTSSANISINRLIVSKFTTEIDKERVLPANL
jgi:hypothetical protein